ncbi:hypothetical protein SLNWT_6544 [Streptomyces albus]|uniref:Uncharacterized protein n=1 Tax=Streptomyces albus (strain ATCC 21838 / DSM 41398 / FERM P-419 / JCM 4703 / NBRC 107858) TaxID=1081613 RepID=A0A0B5F5T5_STRA4|nr:hypothetical protein SLNWT_6544 [Streptomyces albus]AOU81224.1 hypothetical protein SLNHY_6533 [Streptomyces albus]AYN36919.1 hypothetical protein DUI70_6426 [Streptomyces albus]
MSCSIAVHRAYRHPLPPEPGSRPRAALVPGPLTWHRPRGPLPADRAGCRVRRARRTPPGRIPGSGPPPPRAHTTPVRADAHDA